MISLPKWSQETTQVGPSEFIFCRTNGNGVDVSSFIRPFSNARKYVHLAHLVLGPIWKQVEGHQAFLQTSEVS